MADLSEHPVQPLERPVKMKLNPARRAGHCLPAILRPPALAMMIRGQRFVNSLQLFRENTQTHTDVPDLDEGHADGAHPGEGVHRLEPVID